MLTKFCGAVFCVLAVAVTPSLASPNFAKGSTLVVGQSRATCPNAEYATIGAAIAAARDNEVIEICPGLYTEQLTITKPVTLVGVQVDNLKRAVIQPSSMWPVVAADGAVNGAPFEAVITVMNTRDVRIENIAVDASKNGVTDCSTLVAGIHYYNASGIIRDDAVSGALVSGCPTLLFGNGFGIQIDADSGGEYTVDVDRNSIHDFTRDGVQAIGTGVTARIVGNAISGIGPSIGSFQFGVFVLNGAVGLIEKNIIHEGTCGTLTLETCFAARSEGITVRAAGEGTTVADNTITAAQAGIFINGGSHIRVIRNIITNIDLIGGIYIQGGATGYFTDSLIANNVLMSLVPISNEVCGIAEVPGTGVAGNTIANNTVNDAFCGVAYVSADRVTGGTYYNTLYTEFNDEVFNPPPPTEP